MPNHAGLGFRHRILRLRVGGAGEEWLTGTAGTALTLRGRKTAGAERGQERAGSKVRARVEAGVREEAIPLLFQAIHSWSYPAWSGTENILGSLLL